VTDMKITIGYLYPDLMSTNGDRGNVETIIRRCGWRSIATTVTELRLGDKIKPGDVDLIMIGGGGELQQRLVAPDLYKVKAAGIRDAVAAGAAALAVGGGYELFGRFCQPEKRAELRGIELFDSWTIRRAAVHRDDHGMLVEASAERFIGELVVRWRGHLLVGFENHSGGTYLGPAARPLGQVVCGHGNNGDGSEGCVVGAAVGTNLRGPCLPKNPALADFLISAALAHRYGAVELTPLADHLEVAARDVAVRRTRIAARGHGLARALLRAAAQPAMRSLAPSGQRTSARAGGPR
jgi:lipid II isoglutaminyl synthase (glutamine-hydrolysing)